MLAFSLLSGPPAVHLLGNASPQFGFRGSFRGFGALSPADYADCTSKCDEIDVSTQDGTDAFNTCRDACNIDTSTTPSGGGSAPASVPWYQSLFSTGVTAAVAALKPGMPGYIPPKPAPWYTTVWGIGLIAALGIGGYLVFSGKPKSTAMAGHRRRR